MKGCKLVLLVLALVGTMSLSFRRSAVIQKQSLIARRPLLSSYGDDEGSGISLKVLGVGAVVVLGVFGADIFSNLGGAMQSAKQTQVMTSGGPAGVLKGDENRGSLTRLSRREINEKLSQIPVFYVTQGSNEGISIQDGVGFLFVEKGDADAFAKRTGGANVNAATMDDVFFTLIEKKTKLSLVTGIAGKSDPSATYHLQPSSTQLAQTTNEFKAAHPNDVPLFRVTNMAFEKKNGLEVPVFLRKEDALSAYSRLQESKDKGSELKAPDVQVTSVLDLVRLFGTGGFEGRALEVYPSMEAIEQARALIVG